MTATMQQSKQRSPTNGAREAIAGAVDQVRELARHIADAADADQWAIAVAGLRGTGAPDFDELVPRPLLEALSGGDDARYRMTLVLSGAGQDLAVLRMATCRPKGFSDLDVVRARLAANSAAARLARSLFRLA